MFLKLLNIAFDFTYFLLFTIQFTIRMVQHGITVNFQSNNSLNEHEHNHQKQRAG